MSEQRNIGGTIYQCDDKIWKKRGAAEYGNGWWHVTQQEGDLLSELTALRKERDALKEAATTSGVIRVSIEELNDIKQTTFEIEFMDGKKETIKAEGYHSSQKYLTQFYVDFEAVEYGESWTPLKEFPTVNIRSIVELP